MGTRGKHSKLPLQVILHLPLFPICIQERHHVESFQTIYCEGNSPAECWPYGPEIERTGEKINDCQKSNNYGIFYSMQVECFHAADASKRYSLFGFHDITGCCGHLFLILFGELRYIDLEDGG